MRKDSDGIIYNDEGKAIAIDFNYVDPMTWNGAPWIWTDPEVRGTYNRLL